MPVIQANGIELYYEERGEGEPLLLIMGWGGNAATWAPQLPGLTKRFRVITFDNRGAGRTSAPEDAYTIRQMADDTIALLDALGVARAHIFGISMGGMIAQEIAIERADRVGAVVLGCTSAGGDRAPGFDALRQDIERLQEDDTDLDLQWFVEFLNHLWTEEALAKSSTELQDFVLSLIRYRPTLHGLRGQAAAIAAHDTFDRLRAVRQPVLVVTGDEDTLIDPENSRMLARRIPRAELAIFPALKHAFHLERPAAANRAIIDFIEESGVSLERETAGAARR